MITVVISRMLVFCGIVVAVCGLAVGAQATIIYSGSYNQSGAFEIDLDHDNNPDFSIHGYVWLGTPWSTYIMDGQNVVGPLDYASRLTSGTVDSSSMWNNSHAYGVMASPYEPGQQWLGQTGYLGVRFTTSSGLKYGWIHLSVGPYEELLPIIVYDFAYEDSGAGIGVGDTGGGGPAVPEPSSIMVMMSAVLAGFPLYRRFRKNAPVA